MTATTLYSEDKTGKSKIVAIAGMDAVMAAMKDAAAMWAKSKPGRKAKLDGLFLTMRYSDGKLAHVLYADPCPTPAGDEKGQPKRKKA